MPIKIQTDLPARKILESESIFVMTEERAMIQDIRPLKIAIVNLMPIKCTTETQLLRHLSNTPLQVDISLIRMESHNSKHTLEDYLERFYIPSSEMLSQKYDGLIITGAPVEQIQFEQVDYWNELCEIMNWAKLNVFSTLYICWAAQAGLYHHFGIPKYDLPKKMFGVFKNTRSQQNPDPLLRGFDDEFFIPQSRHTEIHYDDIISHPELMILAESEESGPAIIKTNENNAIFITGHLEYDTNTLLDEYWRDKNKNISIEIPKNYFPDDNPNNAPVSNWRSTASLFYRNWLNYYVYQETPYNFVI
ncbi:MAG: homoserine O-succinyltransferase [Treponema sp.]|nr:homoserine O-succinyltransferase [Treponema sp.]